MKINYYFCVLLSMLLMLCVCEMSYAAIHSHKRQATSTSLQRHNSKLAIDINSASPEILIRLKGLGVKKSQAIVNYRKQHGPFKSLQDLAKVRGISSKLVARLIKDNPGRLKMMLSK